MGKPRITQEEFLRRSRAAHGDLYDYREAIYESQNKKVKIICPVHGPFWQTPKLHTLQKSGCEKCGYERRALSQRFLQEEMIQRFREVHGDRYDYSLIEYIGAQHDVQIVCSLHGPFWQRPSRHASGRGCQLCGSPNGKAPTRRREVAVGVCFGQLKVVSPAEPPEGSSGNWWLVKCSCGFGPYRIKGTTLQSKSSTRCDSCGRKEKAKTQRRQLLSEVLSTTYGRLTPLRYWGTTRKNFVKILCVCECGKQWITESKSLKEGNTKSCGCLKAEHEGGDSVVRFRNFPEWASSPCVFYVASLKSGLIKPGIATDASKRKWQGAYSSYAFVSESMNRSDAWAIEQIILRESKSNSAKQAEPIRYGGTSEIRRETEDRPVQWYSDRFNQLKMEVERVGWERLLKEY